MPFTLEFSRGALKALRDMGRVDAERVLAAIKSLAQDPRNPLLDVRPLVGREGVMRLRVGDWRVLFSNDGQVIAIQGIARRREAYR